jgi:hypothetical protein
MLQSHLNSPLQPPPTVQTISGTPVHPLSSTSHALTSLSHALNGQSVTCTAESIPQDKLAIVKLGDEEFAVDRTQIPDPPAKHFSHDIPGLFEQWHHSNCLVVNGRGIPIKHWPQFYQAKKGFKSGAWKAIRVEWGNWKVNCFVVCL